jgi:hypothetical protein
MVLLIVAIFVLFVIAERSDPRGTNTGLKFVFYFFIWCSSALAYAVVAPILAWLAAFYNRPWRYLRFIHHGVASVVGCIPPYNSPAHRSSYLKLGIHKDTAAIIPAFRHRNRKIQLLALCYSLSHPGTSERGGEQQPCRFYVCIVWPQHCFHVVLSFDLLHLLLAV